MDFQCWVCCTSFYLMVFSHNVSNMTIYPHIDKTMPRLISQWSALLKESEESEGNVSARYLIFKTSWINIVLERW